MEAIRRQPRPARPSLTNHAPLAVYTIGHSNHPLERFLELLAQAGVRVLIDVRSSPYSAYCPHFAREPLAAACRAAGVEYHFRGAELGGRPGDAALYDAEGHVLYGPLSRTPAFQRGVEDALAHAARQRTALMCGEEDPSGCHRHLLVARVLRERGAAVVHIRGDGSQVEYELVEQQRQREQQPLLFELSEAESWRSIRSVSREKRPASSSEY